MECLSLSKRTYSSPQRSKTTPCLISLSYQFIAFLLDSDITIPFLTPDQVRNLTFGFLTRLEDKASVEVHPDTEKTIPGYEDARLRYGTNILTRTEYLFRVGAISASLGQFNLQMVGMEAGEWVRFAFPFPSKTNL